MKIIVLFLLFTSLSFTQSSLLLLMSEDELKLPVTENLQFDFDMDVATTANVADQSGNNRTMTFANSPTVNSSALNGYKTVTFNGSDENGKVSAFTSNQPVTLYVVVKHLGSTANRRIADGEGTNSNLMSINGGGGSNWAWGIYAGTAYIQPSSAGNISGQWQILTGVFNTTSSYVQTNNDLVSAASGNIGSSNAGGFTLASAGNNASHSNIEVARVLRYSGAHDSDTRAKIVDYLNKKYKIF